MELCSRQQCHEYFGFDSLDGFRDYVVYVLSYAPDLFPPEEWLKTDQQMNLERAFIGLRYGLRLLSDHVADAGLISKAKDLVEQAQFDYASGREQSGQVKLEQLETLLGSMA